MIQCRPSRLLPLSRMLSTYVGMDGRQYVVKGVLHRNLNYNLNISLALSGEKPFVVKPVSESILEHLEEFKTEFGNNPRLRNHVDRCSQDNVVIYEFFRTDLRSLIDRYPPLPLGIKKSILKEVALALNDMHQKDWIHLDIKPDNVLIDWDFDSNRQFRLQKVVLGDMDCALKLNGKDLLHHRIGNVRWRSPEGQLGRGVGKPSEVFSFALLSLYTITGIQFFDPVSEELRDDPETEVLIKFLSIFGPLSDGLVQHVETDEAGTLLRSLWTGIKEAGNTEPLEDWPEDEIPDLDSALKRIVIRMANLDPRERPSMSEVLEDSYWGRVEFIPHQ